MYIKVWNIDLRVLSFLNCLAKRIEILDLYGKKIKEEDLFLDRMIYRNNISNGLYIYRLYDKYNNEIENGKIIFE